MSQPGRRHNSRAKPVPSASSAPRADARAMAGITGGTSHHTRSAISQIRTRGAASAMKFLFRNRPEGIFMAGQSIQPVSWPIDTADDTAIPSPAPIKRGRSWGDCDPRQKQTAGKTTVSHSPLRLYNGTADQVTDSAAQPTRAAPAKCPGVSGIGCCRYRSKAGAKMDRAANFGLTAGDHSQGQYAAVT